MAASRTGASATATSAPTTETDVKRPDLSTFDDVGRPDIDGWLKAAEGLEIYGRIAGFFAFKQTVKDKDAPNGFRIQTREALCIKLGMPAKLFKKGDEVGFDGQVSQVAAISMMYAIEDVRPYIEKRGLVYIKFVKKVSTGGGQSVWKAIVKCKGEKTAPIKAVMVEAPPAAAVEGGTGGDDEIPF